MSRQNLKIKAGIHNHYFFIFSPFRYICQSVNLNSDSKQRLRRQSVCDKCICCNSGSEKIKNLGIEMLSIFSIYSTKNLGDVEKNNNSTIMFLPPLSSLIAANSFLLIFGLGFLRMCDTSLCINSASSYPFDCTFNIGYNFFFGNRLGATEKLKRLFRTCIACLSICCQETFCTHVKLFVAF